MFGMSAEDDGDRTNPLMRNMPSCNEFEVDVEALRVRRPAGARTRRRVRPAARLSRRQRPWRRCSASESVEFPSNHGGFLAAHYGQPGGDPEGWAQKLREVLDA